MTRGALMLVAWLGLGHATAAGLFVGLVNVPDANIAVLLASLLLAVLVLAVVGVTNVTAVNWLQRDWGTRHPLGAGLRRGLPAVVLALLVYGGFWMITRALQAQYDAHRGELDAWWISHLDSAKTIWVHRTIWAMLFAFRDIVGLSMAVAAFCAVALGGLRGAMAGRWLRAAFSRTQLPIVAMIVVAVAALAWPALGWRPARLPATSVEPLFVAAKIAVIYVMVNAGWALVLFSGARVAAGPPSAGWRG